MSVALLILYHAAFELTVMGSGTTFSGVVSVSAPRARLVRSSKCVPHRRMARRASRLEKCNRFCIGLDQWKLLGKFRPVFCTTNVDKSWLGAWRLKMPTQCPDVSSANGKRSLKLSLCFNRLEHVPLVPLSGSSSSSSPMLSETRVR